MRVAVLFLDGFWYPGGGVGHRLCCRSHCAFCLKAVTWLGRADIALTGISVEHNSRRLGHCALRRRRHLHRAGQTQPHRCVWSALTAGA
eukprot:2288786-Rhodomonas_salina.1